MPRAHYGIDAPRLVGTFFASGLFLSFAAFALHHWAGTSPWMVAVLSVIASYALFMFAYMLWGSLVVKVRCRDTILDLIPWTGREEVLDVGCGRGLMLVGAARRLTTGKATGVDLWIQKDQGANRSSETLENVRRENVSDRVRIETGDMRKLPFADGSFDVVVSNWALHNLELKEDREKSIVEMVRVLKPGGWVLLNDIVNRKEYDVQFNRLGLTGVRVVIQSRWSDVFSCAVSFGSFRPATVLGRKR